ncbi:MAG: 3-methyl-2-oxobutanoate hydroxymethyltransferase [Terriglobia bacterium]
MDPAYEAVSKVTVPLIGQRKTGERIACLTAYDYPTARIADEAGADVILVGDSLGQVVLGYDSTLPVTIDEVLHHLRAVRRGVRRALLVADLPFGSYHVSGASALAASIRLLKEGGAEAVKLEGGKKRAARIRRLVNAEIPVMAHIGLTPQSIRAIGGPKVRGKTAESAAEILEDAQAVEGAGAFAVVLEGIPRELAAIVTRRLRIPTIGIGAGPECDGQILVIHDLLGLSPEPRPKFVRVYTRVAEAARGAITSYCDDVRQGRFPADTESYHWTASVKDEFERESNAPVPGANVAAGLSRQPKNGGVKLPLRARN